MQALRCRLYTQGPARLDVSAVGIDDDSESCQPATVALDAAKNAALFKKGPTTLKSKAKLTINFLVTYDCPDAKPKDRTDPTPGATRSTATVAGAP